MQMSRSAVDINLVTDRTTQIIVKYIMIDMAKIMTKNTCLKRLINSSQDALSVIILHDHLSLIDYIQNVT